MKIQLSSIPAQYIALYLPSIYTNKQQEALSAKVKGEKKIAQEVIQKD